MKALTSGAYWLPVTGLRKLSFLFNNWTPLSRFVNSGHVCFISRLTNGTNYDQHDSLKKKKTFKYKSKKRHQITTSHLPYYDIIIDEYTSEWMTSLMSNQLTKNHYLINC